MASSWIKVEVITPDKPEIYQLAEVLGIDPDTVLGKLIRIWAWADQQTIDGNANGNAACVTKSAIDRITFMPGFADALLQVGWLRYEGNVLIFPNADRHNGESSKKRALTKKRVTEHRENKKKSNASGVTPAYPKALPEVEVELEEELKDLNTLSDSHRTSEENPDDHQDPPAPENHGSDLSNPPEDAGKNKPDPVETAFEKIFWCAGLRKDSKVKSLSAFRTKFKAHHAATQGTPEQFAAMLAEDIQLRVQGQQFGIDKLLPATYLNGERWNDQKPAIATPPPDRQRGPQVFVSEDSFHADF